MDKILERIVKATLLLVCIAVVLRIGIGRDKYQWDFAANYYAAKAYFSGQDPYDARTVSRLTDRKLLPSVYAPFALFFFNIFAAADYRIAYYIYLLLKCIVLLALILLWRNRFLDRQVDAMFYILCALAFNMTIFLDLRAGNIALFEQLAMWLAFWFYLKRRYLWFCLPLVFISAFKIQPLLLLALLLFTDERKKYIYLLGSLVAFLGIYLLPFISRPELFSSLVVKAGGFLKDGGVDHPIDNPSMLWFIQSIAKTLFAVCGIALSEKFQLTVYLGVVILVAFVSARGLSYLRMSALKDKEKYMICLAAVAYALVNPRFKDYSYIILIVPAYFIIKKASCVKADALFFILAIIPSFPVVFNLAGSFYPLLVAIGLWCLYLYHIYNSRLMDKEH